MPFLFGGEAMNNYYHCGKVNCSKPTDCLISIKKITGEDSWCIPCLSKGALSIYLASDKCPICEMRRPHHTDKCFLVKLANA